MLTDLLKVKKIREESAQRVVQQKKEQLKQRQQALAEAKQALQDHIEWRTQEEMRLYDEIMNQHIVQHELDIMRQKIALMREKDAEFEKKITEAQQQVEQAEQELQQAEADYFKARMAVEKFEAFCEEEAQKAALEALRLEDNEMDEFIVQNKQ